MKRKLKFVGIAILITFLLLQFYQPARNKSNGDDLSLDFLTMNRAPDKIRNIVQASCYDCHSNNTNYRWYDYVQPARMFVEYHIQEGKKELNFSEWKNYSTRRQRNKLESVISQVENNGMPLTAYILLHKSARLSAQKKEQLLGWLRKLPSRE